MQEGGDAFMKKYEEYQVAQKAKADQKVNKTKKEEKVKIEEV
jgi:hypothetical protein